MTEEKYTYIHICMCEYVLINYCKYFPANVSQKNSIRLEFHLVNTQMNCFVTKLEIKRQYRLKYLHTYIHLYIHKHTYIYVSWKQLY